MSELLARISLLVLFLVTPTCASPRWAALGAAPQQTNAPSQEKMLEIGVVTLTQVPAGEETSASLTSEPDKYTGIPAVHVTRVRIAASVLQKESTESPLSTASLRGVVVDMGDGQKQHGDGPLIRKIPVDAVQLEFDVFLTDRPEPPIAHGTVPVERTSVSRTVHDGMTDDPGKSTIAPAVPTITMPPVVSEGGVQIMHGQLSGNSSKIRILVDNQPARVVAAEPGTVLWDVPKGLGPGPHRVVVWGDLGLPPVEFVLHIISLVMFADATTMVKGQSTTMHVLVTGLQDLPEGAWASAVPPTEMADIANLAKRAHGSHLPQSGEPGAIVLVLENRSPTTVRMGKQGDYVVLTLHKTDFTNGMHRYEDKLQSLRSGGFNIEGILTAFLNPIRGQPQH